MKLEEKDIKYIIKEVTSILSERRGVLDGKYEELAEEILDKIDDGETFFDIDMPNGNFIMVSVKDCDGSNVVSDGDYVLATSDAEANIDTNTLTVWKTESSMADLKSKIMHELTHFKNAEKGRLNATPMVKKKAFEVFNAAIYLYNDSEMNARLSQFYYWLKNGNTVDKITDANDVLFIKQMYYILYQLYEDYYSIESDGKISLVQWLWFVEKNRSRVDNPYLERLNPHDYNKTKNSMYRKYYKKYKAFCNKAIKILAMFKNESEGGQ